MIELSLHSVSTAEHLTRGTDLLEDRVLDLLVQACVAIIMEHNPSSRMRTIGQLEGLTDWNASLCHLNLAHAFFSSAHENAVVNLSTDPLPELCEHRVLESHVGVITIGVVIEEAESHFREQCSHELVQMIEEGVTLDRSKERYGTVE